MEEFLLRTAYLIGEEALNHLDHCHVAVFGIGGVGGYVAEALCRSGVGELTLVDHDVVSLTNKNRQIIATDETIGRQKTTVMKERLLSIRSELRVHEKQCFFLPETAASFNFSDFDYVVDAVDTVTAKLLLIQMAKEVEVPVISCMGTGNKRYPSMFEITDISKTSVCPLAKVMRRELKKRGISEVKVLFSKEEPIKPVYKQVETDKKEEISEKPVPGSIAFVPPVAGLLIAGEVVNELLLKK